MPTAHRIRWAPKLASAKLVRLYRNDAAGTVDERLLDDVGWALFFRLRDVMLVSASRVDCPRCATEFPVAFLGAPDDALSRCPGCEWETTARYYHSTWEHQDLNAGCPAFAEFVERWPHARRASDRMLLVDAVVHAVHRSGNFAARAFLPGRRWEIGRLLDALATGDGATVATASREGWRVVKDDYDAGRRT